MLTAHRRRSRIAVIGAGLTGTCVALELADAGHDVVLFDRAAQVLSGASWNGEGKIHLGYVYALGAEATARTMIRGALRFEAVLGRWLPSSVLTDGVSDPFVYAVPRDSMVAPEDMERHFDLVEKVLAEELAVSGTAYVAPVRPWRRMSDTDRTGLFDGDEVVAAYRTSERAVDPQSLCVPLREVVAAADHLDVRCGARVEAVHAGDPLPAVQTEADTETFDLVVNCAWEDRLRLDAAFGVPVDRPVVHRYKVGFRAEIEADQTLPTVTFSSGRYGDTVAYRSAAYASWYPAGLLAQEVALHPEPLSSPIDGQDRRQLVDDSIAGLLRLMPSAEQTLTEADWQAVGGYITAWGETGIDDIGSALHSRHEIGVHVHGRYLSVDTGKFTTAPMWADRVADVAAQALVH